MFDLLIKNGKVIDGSGGPAFQADVAVAGDKIVEVAPGIAGEAGQTIDASGLVVSPGFIDMHSHSDFSLLIYNQAESKIHQGVTTEVVGNCGGSPAPVPDEHFDDFMQYASGLGDRYMRAMKPADWCRKTLCHFYETLGSKGVSVNVAPLVGHATLRCHVMGYDDRPPTPDELERMKSLLRTEMEKGCFGYSTGLIYHPGAFGQREELAELAKVVAEFGGLYSTHMRSEGKFLFEAVEEAIWIARQSGVSMEISHLKCETPVQWGKASQLLAEIESARAEGLNINFDQYPYPAFHSGLLEIFPTDDKNKGPQYLISLLTDPAKAAKVREAMEHPADDWDNPMEGLSWDLVRLVGFTRPENKKYDSQTVAEIANDRKTDPLETVFNLFVEENGRLGMIVFSMRDDDIETIMKHPLGMVGSDGSSFSPESARNVHPRNYGTFARVLGHYVRDKKILPLEQAIRRMTGRPAEKLRLKDRGLIQKGLKADITIFDEQTVGDRATFEHPHQLAAGVPYVIVNGVVVVESEKHTRQLPGRVLTMIR